MNEEIKKKISDSLQRRKQRLGYVNSPEARLKLSISKTGKPGHKQTEETRRKIGMASQHDKSPHWKGENAKYSAIHMWVRKYLGRPSICSNCGVKNLGNRHYHWANKSREYKRDLTDWIRLCAKCHKAYDRKQPVLQFS